MAFIITVPLCAISTLQRGVSVSFQIQYIFGLCSSTVVMLPLIQSLFHKKQATVKDLDLFVGV